MSDRRGVYWIDHCVVCTNDVTRWEAFFLELFGGHVRDERLEVRRRRGIFVDFGPAHVGGFIAKNPLPAKERVGAGTPRYGFYVEAADIERHVRQLDALGAIHGEPARTTLSGDPGVILAWEDPDGNQFEFWAPEQLPEGALTGAGSARIGRISHGVFGSRDLQRTADLFERYCDLRPDPNANDTERLALRLAGGARLIFERVDKLSGRSAGFGLPDPHTALLVPNDDFLTYYERMWAGLPELEHDLRADDPIENPNGITPCTVVHVSPAGRRCKAITGRGDDWYDWDTNLFHFYAGVPADESFQRYEAQSMDCFLTELERRYS